jgi:hypothetical protein
VIVMMALRPQGLLTRAALRRFAGWCSRGLPMQQPAGREAA